MSPVEERAFLRALGDCVRTLRLDQGLSQDQLAARAGLSEPTVGQMERGIQAANVVNLWRVAEALRVPLAVLVDEATDPALPTGYYATPLPAGPVAG
jgi:transcriptional regulator with XRE-family HTH domain